MKKLIIAVTIIFVIIIGIATLFLIKTKLKKNVTEKFTVLVDQGTVQTRPSESANYENISLEESELNSGSMVKTLENSSATIILSDNSIISLDQNTEIKIEEQDNNFKVQQLVGNSWHRVKAVTNGNTYEVETPDTVAAVRGTVFAIKTIKENDQATTSVFVHDSQVDIGQYEGTGRRRTFKKISEVVTDDYYLNGKQLSNEEKTLIIKNFKASKWYQSYLEMNNRFKENRELTREELRNLVKKRLQNLSTDNTNTNPDSFLENLREQYDIAANTEGICANINNAEFINGIAQLEQMKVYLGGSYDALFNYLTTMKTYCEDDKLTTEELDSLRQLSESISGS